MTDIKIRHIRILIIITMIIVGGFMLFHLWHGRYDSAVIEAAMLLVNSVVLYLLIRGVFVLHIMHAIMLSGLIGLLFGMRSDPYAVVWFGTLIIGAFAFFGRRLGLYWVVAVNIGLIAFLLADGWSEHPLYPTDLAVHVALASMWMSTIAFYVYRNSDEEREHVVREESERGRQDMAKTLAAGMAHVMNNEILALVGKAECLQFRMKNQEDREELESIITLGLQASEHTAKLASYAQTGRQQWQDVDLYALLDTVLKDWCRAVPSDIHVHMHKPDCETTVFGDEVQIAQMFKYILDNAHDAIAERWRQRPRSAAGHITVRFQREHRGSNQGEYVKVSIADDGVGMSNADKSKIFEPFMTTKAAGRGLGLAAVLGVLRGHRGHIEVESDEGKGSMFHIWLPVHTKHA